MSMVYSLNFHVLHEESIWEVSFWKHYGGGQVCVYNILLDISKEQGRQMIFSFCVIEVGEMTRT